MILLFSFSVPIDIRTQFGHPKDARCLTIIPFASRSFDNLCACCSDFQTVVIKFAAEGIFSIPKISNSSFKNRIPFLLTLRVSDKNSASSKAASPAICAGNEGSKGSYSS